MALTMEELRDGFAQLLELIEGAVHGVEVDHLRVRQTQSSA